MDSATKVMGCYQRACWGRFPGIFQCGFDSSQFVVDLMTPLLASYRGSIGVKNTFFGAVLKSSLTFSQGGYKEHLLPPKEVRAHSLNSMMKSISTLMLALSRKHH